MKIKDEKVLVLFVFVSVLILVASGLYYLTRDPQSSINTESSDSRSDDSADTDIKPDEAPSLDNKITTRNTDVPSPLSSGGTAGKKVAQMVISADITNSTLYIRGGINNASVQDGKCSVKLTGPNGRIVQKDTTLLQNAATTDCKTIFVSTSELASGSWTAILYYSSNELEGASDAASFSVP